METNVINNYRSIQERINKIKKNDQNVNIISISKTFSTDKITPLLNNGNIHFGENKVQEALEKWPDIKKNFPKVKLHMVGKLQTNKVKKAIKLFDFIHSLDNYKLAETLAKNQLSIKKNLNYFIQIRLGDEQGKSGILLKELDRFYNFCTKKVNLNIVGLMAIPPNDGNEEKYFKVLYDANTSLGLKEISMGMSGDFEKAIKYNSTFVRIGSAIFGERN